MREGDVGVMSAKRILIASARGGVGKSSVAVHLAAAYAASGKKTLLLDLASSSRALDLLLGLSDEAIYDLGDLLGARVDGDRVLLPVPGADRLAMVPGLFRPSRLPTLPELLRSLVALEEASDAEVIILDSSWDELALRAASASELALIVADTDRISIRAAENTAAALGDIQAKLILNRFSLENPVAIVPILESVHLPLAGIIPEEPRLRELENLGQPLLLPKDSLLPIAYRNIVCRLEGGHMPLLHKMPRIKRRKLLQKML
jgi:septum site-determining protein MinD